MSPRIPATFIPREECQLCGSAEREPFDFLETWGHRFTWVRCRSCGLVYMDPLPDVQSYLRLYRETFWELKHGDENAGVPDEDTPDEALAGRFEAEIRLIRTRRVPRIRRLLSDGGVELGPRSRVLEVGCGCGENLVYLRETHGCGVSAVEPSELAVRYLKLLHPEVDILARSAEELFEGGPKGALEGEFDLVIFSHCLENVTDQSAALRAVHRMLRPGGALYIDTSSLYWHTTVLNPYHPFVYEERTLRGMLARHGFTRVSALGSRPPSHSFALTLSRAVARPPDPYLSVVARRTEGAPPGRPPHPREGAASVLLRRSLGHRAADLAQRIRRRLRTLKP